MCRAELVGLGMQRWLFAMCAVAALGRAARAEPLVPPALYDDGSWLFVWGALAAREVVDRYVAPPDRPLGFSAEEGGARPASWEVPGYAVTASAGIVAATLLASGAPSRWQHAKGLAQTLSTGALLTLSLKVAVGRRRPDQGGAPGGGFGGESRSFPSGHATQAFEIATYTALYLHTHTFARERRWWHAAVHAGLYGTASLVAAERVWHRRHHLSDVVAGAALGSAVATAFFFAHERAAGAARPGRLWLTPGPEGLGLGLAWRR